MVIIIICVFIVISYIISSLLDVFKNFRNKCIGIYKLGPAHFLSALELAWQTCLKKTKIKLELSIDVDMLQMVEKEIRGGICHENTLICKSK